MKKASMLALSTMNSILGRRKNKNIYYLMVASNKGLKLTFTSKIDQAPKLNT